MQKHRVVAWLSQHNFPHGVVSFCDGLTHDPLRQKAMFLQSLVQEVRRWEGTRLCPQPISSASAHLWDLNCPMVLPSRVPRGP